MNYRFSMMALLAAITLSACSSISLWPFGDKKMQEQSHAPANATEYQCSGGKQFYVRLLDKGETAWLMLPDREVALAKSAGATTRYSNGISTLSINGNEATLEVSPTISYTDCKAAGK